MWWLLTRTGLHRQDSYVSDQIDPTSRSAKVRCIVQNQKHELKLEMFATVHIPTSEKRTVLAIPAGSIQKIDGKAVAFVQLKETEFAPRELQLRAGHEGWVEVVSGLIRGEKVVRRRQLYLKSHLQRERIGGEERLRRRGGVLEMYRIVDFALKNRFLILVSTGLLLGVGLYSMIRLPIDAVPDVTPNQVQILTEAPGLGPIEVEKLITFSVETAMSGLPGITDLRSISRFGLSAVYLYFNEDLDIYFARRLVLERLPQARAAIPPGFGTPEMGPISTGLGEIYQFEVGGQGYSLMELRSILEWDIAFKLRSVPGVVEVNSYGGELKTYEVQLDANKLVSYKISLEKVFEALQRNDSNSGGGSIQHNQEQYLIRGEGLVTSLDDIDNIVVSAEKDGAPGLCSQPGPGSLRSHDSAGRGYT